MRKLLVFLVILIIVVVGIDIGGRAFAESKAGEAIAIQTGTTAPSVDIHGFSFLVQALRGKYSNITLTSSDVTAGPISGIGVTIDLYDVNFPIGDAVKGDTSNLTAAQAHVTGVIPDSQVTAALAQSGATISEGPGGAIRVAATVDIAGTRVPVTATLVPSFTAGTLRLDATNLTAAGVAVPNIAQLTRNLSLALPLKDLPFAVQAATLVSSGANLVLTASANDIRIGSVA
ncbi:hypothetical protein ABIB25_001505 [Nakamurella sp. UYEF19]|uniref:LmeA family phospholipid-binding protein n=1 Tax=Nakamurella sp. UYEF19 TaxID=1756392 RepID=UPI0033958187